MIKQNTSTRSERLLQLLAWLGCTLCLLIPALYNGYPLVNPDTGAYVSSGWGLNHFHVPIDRPIGYSIFIRVTSLSGLSLWGVAVAQTLILVYFLRRVTKKLLNKNYSERLFFAIIILLATCTSAGWFSSHLLPDIFAAILLLAIADLYLTPLSSKKGKALYFFAIWFIMNQHNSHLLIALVLCLFAGIYYLIKRKRWFLKKTLFLFYITLFSFISMSFFNLWSGNGFRPSASTHVFLMARMAENGILDKFLKEYCPVEHYSLCDYQNKTGDRQWDFMWGEGHLQAAGGWDKTAPEYNKIIFKTLANPKYLGLHIYESLEAGTRQLSQFMLFVQPQTEGTSPYSAIDRLFPREIKEYRTSMQQRGVLPEQTGFMNGLLFIFLVITSVLTLFIYDKNNKGAVQLNWNFFLVLIVSGLLINGFATAVFSTVVDRLQARVFWLLPFACLIFIVNNFKEKLSGAARQ